VNGRPVVVNGPWLQSNANSSMGWIVQKFGGTSIGKFPEKIVEDVVGYLSLGSRPEN
jgi:aspartate kinase